MRAFPDRIGFRPLDAMKARAGVFVFAGLHDFPPGRNKRKANEDGNAGVMLSSVRRIGNALACDVDIGRSRGP
jgi:hypothetical protein